MQLFVMTVIKFICKLTSPKVKCKKIFIHMKMTVENICRQQYTTELEYVKVLEWHG